jgi:hypothetical protein
LAALFISFIRLDPHNIQFTGFAFLILGITKAADSFKHWIAPTTNNKIPSTFEAYEAEGELTLFIKKQKQKLSDFMESKDSQELKNE